MKTLYVVQRRSWYAWWNDDRGGWCTWEDLDSGCADLSTAQYAYAQQVEIQNEIVTTLKPKSGEHTTRQYRIVKRVILSDSVVVESGQIGPSRTSL